MNHRLTHLWGNVIAIFITVALIASGCGPAATPSPTAIPPTPTPLPPTPTLDPLSIVKAYEEAFNRHDLEAVMALFAENSRYQYGNWQTGVIKKEIRDLHGYFNELHAEIQNTNCTATESEVNCQAVMYDDCVRAAEMGNGQRFPSAVYHLDNEKIDKVTLIELAEDDRALTYFLFFKVFTWASQNRQEEYNKLNSSPWWNGDGGRSFSILCLEYAKVKP